MIKPKNYIFLILISIITSCANHQNLRTTEQSNQPVHNGIQIGQFDSLHSKVLNQERKLIIYLPQSYNDPERKKDQYPVVYLLDGSGPFLPFVGMLKQYSEMNDTKILPEMIVVGIENIDFKSRMMDFSPTTEGNPEEYGGGNDFLKFMKTELFPYIEQNYSGSQNRSLVGHSFGGLVVMNALTRHPEMFTNYLLIDGSLYFDNELFLKNKEFSLAGKDLKDKNLFIAIANTATYGSDLESIKNDTISANRYVRHSLDLVDQIQNFNTGLNMKWKYYENDTHGSTAYVAQNDGFRFFYSWFEFKEETKYRGKYNLPTGRKESYANLTRKHFEMVSDKIGYDFYPSLPWFLGTSNMLLNFHELPGQAKDVLILAETYYPDNPEIKRNLDKLN